MYTRCPSCRAEISFEPPANVANLPDGYKHRIKCPSCGVTIGVKIPRVDATATVLPTYMPANPNATSFEPIFQANAVESAPETRAEKKARVRATKKSGIGRNILMFLFSLIFVGLNICGYLVSMGVIPVAEGFSWIANLEIFNGIKMWITICTDTATISAYFAQSPLYGIILLVPMVLFTLAALNAIVSIISMFGKKYGRAYNVIVSILICALACIMLFIPLIMKGENVDIAAFFLEDIIGGQQYFLLAGAIVGVLQFIFSLFFIKSLKIKQKQK